MELLQSSEALLELSEFLLEFHPLINICMVDFVTKDLFSRVLSPDVADQLSQLSDEQIIAMPEKCANIQKVFFVI